MCGRVALIKKFEEIAAYYNARPFGGGDWKENYNVCPTNLIPVLVEEPDGLELRLMKWGLIPFWAKAENIAAGNINARAETIQEKPGFRDSFKDKRCIIPASGFYEWQKLTTVKQPYYFTPKDGLFSFAGLWSRWISPDSVEVESCAIITTNANEIVKPIHDRMPVALGHNGWSTWMAKKTKAKELLEVLSPLPATQMNVVKVSKYVNSSKSLGAECIAPMNTR
jgi:putative SOS response-associated peptidase YedK